MRYLVSTDEDVECVCRAATMYVTENVDDDDSPCPAHRTAAQARMEKAAPAMLAALKGMCIGCGVHDVQRCSAVTTTCPIGAAIRAAEEG